MLLTAAFNQFLFCSLKPDICCNTVSKFTLNQFWPISVSNFHIELNYKCFESSGVLIQRKERHIKLCFGASSGLLDPN